MNPVNQVTQKVSVINQKKCGENNNLTGVAIDPETEIIYVANWSGNCIIAYNKQLERQEISKNKFLVRSPRGLRFKHGLLYVAESDGNKKISCVKVFQREGTLLQEFGSWGSNDSQFRYSLALDVDTYKNMYICNSGEGIIKVVSKEGKFISKFGRNNLVWPIDIRIHKTLIYVLGYRKPRMFVFDLEHNFVTEFCLPIKGSPSYFVLNSSDELIYSDNKCVNLLKVNGSISFILEYPHHHHAGRKGIEMDSEGRIINVLLLQGCRGCYLQVIEDP